MRRTLLPLLALLPVAIAALPALSASSNPRGEVVFRPECLGDSADLELSSVRPPPPPPTPVAAPPATTSRSEVLTKEFLEKIPSGRSYQTAVGSSADAAPKRERGKSGKGAPSPSPAPPPEMEAPADLDEDGPSINFGRDKPIEKKNKARDLGDDGAAFAVDEILTEERSDRDWRGEGQQAQRGPTLDWGATVYLSNDDSMSLASAQRLLFAVMNGVGFSPREVRPHELLNYFSFDTVTPDGDQLFDVLASAEQQGDKLSVALAVKGAAPQRQPLDLTLLVDRSCSMQAEGRMAYTKRGLGLMRDQLAKGDRIDVVLFDDRTCVPLQNFVVGRDDDSLLERTIAGMEPDGGTDLDLGLKEAYSVAKAHLDTHGRNRRVMVLTDAMLNTGDVNHDTVSEIGKAFEGDAIRMTGVGVGREFNDEVLDMLTEKGKGAYVFLGSEAVVDRVFGPTGFDSLVQTIAHDVHFALNLPDSLAMERFYGEEASTVKADVQPLNYYAGTSQLFLQDLTVKDGRADRSDAVELVVTYRDALTGEPETRTFRTTIGKMLDTDPHNVRKGLALMAWSDMLMAEAMGADPCGRDLEAYASRAGSLSDDAEIGFVNGLIRGRCGDFDLPTHVSSASTVEYKVKVDADIPIAEVALACGGQRWSEALTGSDTVARFSAVPGVCDLTLSGTVDMKARVEVPQTGGDLRCIVRGGRLSCS